MGTEDGGQGHVVRYQGELAFVQVLVKMLHPKNECQSFFSTCAYFCSAYVSVQEAQAI